MSDPTTNQENGEYNFSINYSERMLTCHVTKKGNQLHVHIDNNMDADFELQPDNSLKQVSGAELPDSTVEFIKKHVLGQDK